MSRAVKKNVVTIGLVGAGTVGQGFLKIFQKDRAGLEAKAGARLRVKWVASRRDKRVPAGARFTRHWRQVIGDPEVDIVVELIGGEEPARTVILSALRTGKHVATANKAVLAKHWDQVFSTAQSHNALVYFEAAVGSGIPVIQGLIEGLGANRIERIYGILNGTTNYILTRMTEAGVDFETALEEAQAAGFAEADPSLDVEGTDAAHKLVVLASSASGVWVRPAQVSRQGISRLDVWDLRFARERLGLVTKLLGIYESGKGAVSARVYPALLPVTHPFANVRREYNAIFVHGDAVGDVMFYGKGAGQLAAASAVASDVLYLSRQVANGTAGQIPYVTPASGRDIRHLPLADVECRHYLRFTTQDKPGVLAQITTILGRNEVSIASVYQEEYESRPGHGMPIVIMTHGAREGDVQTALQQIDRLPLVRKKTVHLRVEEGE